MRSAVRSWTRPERGDQARHARHARREFLGEPKRLWSGQRWPGSGDCSGTGRAEAGTKCAFAPRGIERSVLENGLMVPVSFVGLLIVALVAFLAPLLLGLSPARRLP